MKYLQLILLYLLCFVFQRDHMKIAQQFFQLVGGSASECGVCLRSMLVTTSHDGSWLCCVLTDGV